MSRKVINPDEVKAAFELYLLYNGENFDEIEKEMHRRGWTEFKKAKLKSRGFGENRRAGWIEKFGWDNALKLRAATAGTVAVTSAESLLFEVESIRKKLFTEIEARGIARAGKDAIYQHDKYVNRSIEILAQLNDARDNFANFRFFLQHLIAAAPKMSTALATALIEAEDGLLDWAEANFATSDNSDDAGRDN